MDMEKSKSSWWQTLPGVMTAVAAVITAVAGLLVTLNQIGVFGTTVAPVPPAAVAPAAVPTAARSPLDPPATGVSKPTAAVGADRVSVSFPSVTAVTLRSAAGEATYEIISAGVARRGTDTLTLSLVVRLTNQGRWAMNFWDRTFRLVIDGVPRAPVSNLNEVVEPRSAKEGSIAFDIPSTAADLTLLVGDGPDAVGIRMQLSGSP